MDAVKGLDLLILCVFGAGALVGITSFSRVLSYALKHFRNVTMAVLAGFMLGSLNKVWPWKTTEIEIINGTEFTIEHNSLPTQYLVEGVVLMIVGFMLVYVLEKISAKKS